MYYGRDDVCQDGTDESLAQVHRCRRSVRRGPLDLIQKSSLHSSLATVFCGNNNLSDTRIANRGRVAKFGDTSATLLTSRYRNPKWAPTRPVQARSNLPPVQSG
ncbi:unnamed protein product [Protopolystoma xenopodis]|uniref:Uncharacterized protein n=1 Tax=Protopolystoma xenopodis TaxID=117903 RepID=A0A448X0F9_9PLAT|nr:unnamed protein product [Protopolystoma xenopodis]